MFDMRTVTSLHAVLLLWIYYRENQMRSCSRRMRCAPDPRSHEPAVTVTHNIKPTEKTHFTLKTIKICLFTHFTRRLLRMILFNLWIHIICFFQVTVSFLLFLVEHIPTTHESIKANYRHEAGHSENRVTCPQTPALLIHASALSNDTCLD